MKVILLLIALLLSPLPGKAEVYTIRVEGPIDTLLEEYVVESLQTINEKPGARLIVLLMDTPGGFDTSMRSIIKAMVNSQVPVAAYVSPRAARAASAGFFIAIAADIAAMAPGTNMGAAAPVSVSGTEIEQTMRDKITNDAVSYIKTLAGNRGRNVELAEKAVSESKSYTAEECLENNLIEYIAGDLEELLLKLQNKVVKRSDGTESELDLTGAAVIAVEMSARQKILRTITNPNIAYFLLIFGLIGLYLEFSNPGIIIPGVIGGISLLLAFLAFQILPINYTGVLLILLSFGFFIAEIKVQGFGMLGVGGFISFLLGSLILIDAPIPEMRPAMTLIATVSIVFAVLSLALTYKVFEAMKRKTPTGSEGLVGETGTARTAVTPSGGKVFVHGEWWNAVSDQEIPSGARIRVEAREDMVLKVSQTGGK